MKLQVINLNIKGIKCDNCDYRDNDAEFIDYEKYLNKPCPWCGAPLLTQKDLILIQRLVKCSNFINRVCRFLRINPKETTEKLKFRVDMNGTGRAIFNQKEDA